MNMIGKKYKPFYTADFKFRESLAWLRVLLIWEPGSLTPKQKANHKLTKLIQANQSAI